MEKKEITLNEYQEKAMATCMASCNNLSYMFFNLVGEVGEFAGKVAKWIRKEKLNISGNELTKPFAKFTSEDEVELRKEAGDILWQLSGLCSVMGWSLEDVAQENLDKLADRQKRNVIVGEGDNR
jgi:NTP pyrophosphatase (non-canonical NTP hydrolase)